MTKDDEIDGSASVGEQLEQAELRLKLLQLKKAGRPLYRDPGLLVTWLTAFGMVGGVVTQSVALLRAFGTVQRQGEDLNAALTAVGQKDDELNAAHLELDSVREGLGAVTAAIDRLETEGPDSNRESRQQNLTELSERMIDLQARTDRSQNHLNRAIRIRPDLSNNALLGTSPVEGVRRPSN